MDRLQLKFSVPEVAISLGRPGANLDFSVASYPGETFSGEVYFVAPSFDPSTRRLLIKAWVPNPGHRLHPGQFANIRAEVGRREHALVVPEAALVMDREGTFVWRVGDDDTARRAPVNVGARIAGRVEIVDGLKEGDRVVAAGTNKVRTGALVRAVVPAMAAEPEPTTERETADLHKTDGEGS